ncbi:hypothetical protein [Kingella sp. (in: b-proteobacteria)]|uniref:hypothetical protein n=1 Tax=Kingella sp. (in: b-proteobacteria) TaxID=2020713 RepID=UPI0026DB3277|nr:hypothetical protein [Kingella sp. (in: b-proteobacteria)]MDO4656591.1 hypothetical protein [Kingella sp. (in: b-proteobacteria)]
MFFLFPSAGVSPPTTSRGKPLHPTLHLFSGCPTIIARAQPYGEQRVTHRG